MSDSSSPTFSWLSKHTGRDTGFWIEFIQKKIAEATTDRDTDVKKWLVELSREVELSIPAWRPDFDENIRASAIMGLVLLLWHFRVRRAKCCDPRRPIGARRKAYEERRAFALVVMDAIMDDTYDSLYFPGQDWESPVDPVRGGNT